MTTEQYEYDIDAKTGKILDVEVDDEILPVHVIYDAYDGTTVTYGDYFTPDYVDGTIEVKYEVEVYDEDGIEMCKFNDSFEFE